MVNLLAFDLDGTLLERDGNVAAHNLESIAAARRAGLGVVLVTGRSWRGTQPIYQQLALTLPAICYLGATVVEGATGRLLHHRPLTWEAWQPLREIAVAEGLAVTACLGADQAVADGQLPSHDLLAADTAFAVCRTDEFVAWDDWNPYTVVAPDLSPCKAPPIMAAIYGERAVRRVYAAFPDGLPESQFDLMDRIKGETVLHIWHRDVNKGSTLAQFCRERGIGPGEVAAFGDAPMDLSMLAFAGVGVAVPNAHPALLEAADWVMWPAEAIARILAERVT